MSVGAVNKNTGDRIPTAGNPLDKVGNLASLHTTAKNDAVSAINEVKDEQANKADNDIVADAFSAAETYAEGDYCTYEGGLYKFKTSHSGAWDAADVDQIQIAGELSELKNTLTYTNYGTIDTSTVFSGNLCKASNIAFLKITDFVSLASGETILTGKIPAGFRPPRNFNYTLIERSFSDLRCIAVSVEANGNIIFYNYGSAISTATAFGETISWPISS